MPLSQIDLTSPPPEPTAVAKAVPRPILPPASGEITTPAKAPALAPTAISFAYSFVVSSAVPPMSVPVLSSVFMTAEIGMVYPIGVIIWVNLKVNLPFKLPCFAFEVSITVP